MDTFGLIFSITIVLAIIIGLKSLIKARKKAELKDIEKFNKFKLYSEIPDKELSRSAVLWLARIIALIELLTIFGLVFILVTNKMLGMVLNSDIRVLLVVCVVIIWAINLFLKRYDAYEKGKWLTKYSYMRIYFFLPIFGGYFLLRLKTK